MPRSAGRRRPAPPILVVAVERRADHGSSSGANTAWTGGVPVTFTGHALHERLEPGEADRLTGQVGERVPPAGQHVERRPVRGDVDAERAEHAQLLVDDVVGVEAGRLGVPAGAGDHDGAAGAGERDGLGERERRLGRDVDDDVGQTAGGGWQRGDRVVDRHVDRQVGAEGGGEGEAFGIALARVR